MKIDDLSPGQEISFTGKLIVMRDAAQMRLKKLYEEGEPFPVELEGAIVFYAGPAKLVEESCGAIGPTTSLRMDGFLEMLFEKGVLATIGKGKRSDLAANLCKEFRRVYLIAPSGAAASLAQRIESLRVIAYEDLGTEAIFEIDVRDFPLIVATDVNGSDFSTLNRR